MTRRAAPLPKGKLDGPKQMDSIDLILVFPVVILDLYTHQTEEAMRGS